ncbi:hypothetical protein [Endothiovibrio diazotrophicus]
MAERPVFVFDPHRDDNRLPSDPDYATARRRWALCPPSLQELFTRAFTVGLRQPGRRVTEGEWQALFRVLEDGAIDCPHCRAENLAEARARELSCWHCRKTVPLPLRLGLRLRLGTMSATIGSTRKTM